MNNPREILEHLLERRDMSEVHAASLLRELGAKQAVIPPEAGVQSAWGLLVADMRRDFQQDRKSVV